MTSGDEIPDTEILLAAVRPLLSVHFKSALLARMTVIPYFTLARHALADIVRLKLNKMRFTYTDALVEQVVARCTEVETGARNLDFILRGNIMPMMSQEILACMSGEVQPTAITLDVGEDGDFKLAFAQ